MERRQSRQASISSVLNATIYESSVITGLRIAFWNDARGISISNVYTNMKTSSRTFNLETDPHAIKMAQSMLKKNGWELLSSQFSTAFQEIQVDVLFHIHVEQEQQYEFRENVKFFNAQPEPLLKGLLRKKVSKSIITENDELVPNSYMVVEITMDENRYIEKLQQVERDLTVLLCRKRLETNEFLISIEEIVCFAGIATNHLDMRECNRFIDDHFQKLPMIYRLYQLGRFFYFKQPQDVKDIVYQVSHHSSIIDKYEKSNSEVQNLTLSNERKRADILSAERELMELKIVQQKQQMF
jgi:hypothetical protein